MPRVCGRGERLLGVATLALCVALLAACSGGGGGSGGSAGASAAQSAGTSPDPYTSTVTLGWAGASGPVAGYVVWVQRGSGSPAIEEQVSAAQVTLRGEKGSKARISVAAFDASGLRGPASELSPWFTFPGAQDSGDPGGGNPSPQDPPPDSGGDPPDDPGSDPGTPDDPPDAPSPSLAGGLFWEAGDALRVTGADLETLAVFSRPWSGAQLAAIADLDGDGAADLLFSDAAGALAYLPGADLASGTALPVDLAPLEADEQVIGAGDLDGDGIDDLLVARSGVVDAWFTLPGGDVEILEIGAPGPGAPLGIADVDGDGRDDVVWSSGSVLAVWLMDAAASHIDVTRILDAGVELMALGDLDGDGLAELAARNAAGEVALMEPLDGRLAATDLAGTTGWESVGATDVDGDGSDDLVLVSGNVLGIGTLPGEIIVPLDPTSPWTLTALLP